jgi:Ca2+/H+ antiporter, TMEM165/GDT1 family
MDARVLSVAFVTLFLAELGDKTQLAVLTLSASTQKPWTVFLGASAALVLLTALAALLGGVVGRVVPELVLRRASAALFVVMGVWMWFKK